jgi:adenosine 3'-phospho 5'-phosphosulfate transporter B3
LDAARLSIDGWLPVDPRAVWVITPQVSYTTKVAFKSAKLVPTMVVATATGSRGYTIREYSAAVLLCVGAGSFAVDPGHGSNNREDEASQWSQAGIGLSMLGVAIMCDAFVPNAQARLLESKVSAHQLMVNTNLVGLGLAVVWMIARGEVAEVVAAAALSPLLLGLLVIVGVSLAGAVLCYTMLIKAAGPVVAVSVATLRKTATIALSFAVFPKPMTPIQAVGITAVLGGVVLASKSSAAGAKWLCGVGGKGGSR